MAYERVELEHRPTCVCACVTQSDKGADLSGDSLSAGRDCTGKLRTPHKHNIVNNERFRHVCGVSIKCVL